MHFSGLVLSTLALMSLGVALAEGATPAEVRPMAPQAAEYNYHPFFPYGEYWPYEHKPRPRSRR